MNRLFIGIDVDHLEDANSAILLLNDENSGYVLYSHDVRGPIDIGDDFLAWINTALIEVKNDDETAK